MDLIFICRDSLASSLLSNLLLAMEAKKNGAEAGVFFTEEAMAAVGSRAFIWPRGLVGQELRMGMADIGKAMGLPVMGRGVGRQLDVRQLIDRAREAGVSMFACLTWIEFLGLRGKLPKGIAEVDLSTAIKTLQEAKTVIGSF